MHGHHTDIFVYCLYDTVLKYFDFGKRVLSEERQTRPAHSCGQFQVFPCHTPLDQTHPPCCMFRFVGESLISSGDDSLWRLMQHPFQYTMMHKKAYRELPIYIYHFSEIAAICSDFMFFVHHSFEMLWGHQENNTTQLDLVQKARAGKMQIFLQAVITISPYIHCIYTETKKNKHGSNYSNAFNAVATGGLHGTTSIARTWIDDLKAAKNDRSSHCTCNCSGWVCTQHLTCWNIDFKI